MKYMKLSNQDRQAVLQELEDMPAFLSKCFASLSESTQTQRTKQGDFSPVEHVWHLADLEKEGFTYRIDQLLHTNSPSMADFKGGDLARERNYRTRSIKKGLKAFRAARIANLAKIQNITDEQWQNTGELEGYGEVSLCDIPELLAQHDAEHRKEIDVWMAQNN